ncbi:phosphatidylinositol 4,5-bisphosphate 3-kinase catalytic subunit beta isoform-like [Lineus longissimus]|uniref:phosphatidylinositol 4,5-bisphosphate 3-kinase catalytic subunit beta isoform-like n=1 Tax=Lineus longissimus TaxID=88925 RepID=UPI002B4C6215
MAPALVDVFQSEVWSLERPLSSAVIVDCLLPNGILIPLTVQRDTNLMELKTLLWVEAEKYPLYTFLGDMDCYLFMCVNSAALKEELVDESRRLIDIQPFHLMLRVVQKKGNRGEKLVNSQISFLIGKGLQEFEGLGDPEVNDFRKSMKEKCMRIEEERSQKGWHDQILYFHPPSINEHTVHSQINKDILISVYLPKLGIKTTKRISTEKKPTDLIQTVLRKRTLTTGIPEEPAENYCLKIVGEESYLVGDHKLIHFTHIQKLVSTDKMPQLVLKSEEELLQSFPPLLNLPKIKAIDSSAMGSPFSKHKYDPVLLWKIPNHYSVSIKSISNVSCPDDTKLQLRVGIFHGGEALADMDNTKAANLTDGEALWNTAANFNLALADLPRMARLSFALYTTYDKKMTISGGKTMKFKDGKQKIDILPLAWLNTTIFDYKNMLRTGPAVFNMWQFTEDVTMEDIVNPIGTVEDNPLKEGAPKLELVFHDYGIKQPIRYPPFSKVLECAAENTNFKDAIYDTVEDVVFNNADELDMERLILILETDPLTPMCEQEKKLVWKMRYECQYQYPQSLPRLLTCVQWNNHNDVATMMALLQIWPKLPPEQALELLDFCYADTSVREFAVVCLKELSDSDLLHYLLQLVQAIKYESYLECELVEFLLTRALNNRTIGHHLFWLLRSEMHVPSVAVRFGLILEAYCRGSTQHLKDLTKQCEALRKLQSVNLHIKNNASKGKEKNLEGMRACLQQDAYSDALCGLQSPLDPCNRLRQLRHDKCKFMDSKMKPLWLVWENQDSMGSDVYTLFKNGDDLRQDMLTLQILRIMDKLWQAEGLDLRLIPYKCISTGPESGLIEIVLNSQTIANIQKKNANSAILSVYDKTALFKWFKDHNESDERLNRAVEAFTLSCAGYCVATYVLGIGDRHNDNIMVTESGQLFHIDFGHFLGNFKSKFGVRRERVPFVLTHDFVYVITKGKQKVGEQKNELFQRFQQYCEQAYLILRQKGNFLISLFMMMLSTGIPELTCLEDIKYIRDTLALTMDEENALKHFRAKFDEALRNSWKTSLNWLAHNMARDNT